MTLPPEHPPVPRIRLRVWQHGHALQYSAPRRSGQRFVSPSLRLMAKLALGPDPPRRQRVENRIVVNALIDTGASHSALISGTWESYERLGLLERLTLAPNTPPLQLAGGIFRYELGRM